jgi:hydrogenase maturation protease
VTPRITVLGIGNLLLRDEGVGVHLAQELARGELGHADFEIIEAGTCPDILSLLDEGIDKLIVVDAVKGGNEPGTLYRLTLDDLTTNSAVPISLHEMGVVENLKMMSLLGRQPKSVVFIGVEPKIIDYGLELSPEVAGKLPDLVELVCKEVEGTKTAMEVTR